MQNQIPTLEPLRNLSNAAPGDTIPAIGVRHSRFQLAVCLAFAALYAELTYFAASYYNSLPNNTLIMLVAGVFLLAFGGYFAAMTLPHRIFKPKFHEFSPIMFLTWEWTLSIVITVLVTLLTLGCGIWAVKGDLGAVGEIIRSLALYGLTGSILLHGIVMYVRYVRYLYEREMHQSYKIVTVGGVSAVIATVLILYFLPFDLGRMGGHEANAAFLALHLTIRDVGLIVTTLFILMWHFTCLADH